MEMFVFTGILWKEDSEFSALCPELDVASQGKTSAEARKNLLEAAILHLEGCFEDGLPYLRPVPVSEAPLLRLDHDGDGSFDETIAATSVLGPMESADNQPPQIVITNPSQDQVLAGGTLVTWQAGDDLSGVLNEWGIIDLGTPTALSVTDGTIVVLPAGDHTLTVLAEDRLGNVAKKEVTFTVYPFEWLPPISTAQPYVAKVGRAIPIKFKVSDLAGTAVRDESVELWLLDDSGNTVAGPFTYAANPDRGVAILGNGQYHHNLRTAGLRPGIYTIRVAFNLPQLGGVLERMIELQP